MVITEINFLPSPLIGGGVTPDAIARGCEDRGEHGTKGAFAVRPCHVYKGKILLRISERVTECADAPEPGITEGRIDRVDIIDGL